MQKEYQNVFQKISDFRSLLETEIQLLNKAVLEFEKTGQASLISKHLQNGAHNFAEKERFYKDDIFSYQVWIGELGKTIADLVIGMEHYKSRCLKQAERISGLSHDWEASQRTVRDLNERLATFSLLKKELNQLYNQFYLIREQKKELENKGYIKLSRKIKKAFLNSKKLADYFSKAGLFIRALASLKFKTYLKNNRLFKRYDWEVNYIKDSGTFDYHFYLSRYPDIQSVETDPVRHYVVHGYKEGRSPNAVFDSEWYLKIYDDIRNSDINPFLHYLQKGIYEKRRPNSGFDVEQLNIYLDQENYAGAFAKYLYQENSSNQPQISFPVQITGVDLSKQYQLKQIVYVSGLYHNTSHQFRVADQIDILKHLGYDVISIPLDHLEEHEHLLIFAEVVVLFRVAWNETLERIIAKCKEAGVVIVYDTDDYVFDPGIANEKHVDGIRFLSEKEKKLYHEGVLAYQTAVASSDIGLFTTPMLDRSYKQIYNKPSYIIKNGFSDYFFETSMEALKKRPVKTSNVIIGYASGSLTHQKDFKVASRSVARVLKKYPHAVLRIVGLLNVDEFPEFLEFKDQIQVRPVATHKNLPYELSEFDINLAPLEVDNPFCEAKSDLKYFEAALVRVPTVASATEPYRISIKQGKTGYLASTEQDWFNHLDKLVSDHPHRLVVADEAYMDTIERYSSKGKEREVKEAFEKIYEYRDELFKKNTFTRTVTFVLPEMMKGSGGHAKAISVAKWLTQFGHTVSLNFIGNHTDYLDARMIEEEFQLETKNIRVIYTDLPQHDSNIIVATFWKTVYYIQNATKRYGRKFHFLQDYEPYFYSMGTDYLLSINAMKKDFHKISYGPWIKEIIHNKHKIECDSMPFYYNKGIYFNDESVIRSKNVIVFFARPEMPRRCFDLGWRALQLYTQKYPSGAQIVIFGSYAVEHINIGFEHTNLNVRPPAELANLYRSATLGIAFSPTNPSMVPFEMMACGLPVLDLDVEGNEINYGGRQNLFLVSPDENEIADKIHSLLSEDTLREQVARRGQQFIEALPNELEAIQEFEKILMNDK
jgi:glycosyltransferase involved in cell wall biosynthesis